MPRTGNPNWKLGCSPTNPTGRPRGSQNKSMRVMQDIILGAANEVGGIQELVRWYRESPANRLCFWKEIAPRVLPKVIDAAVDTGPRTKIIENYLVGADGMIVDLVSPDNGPMLDPVYARLHGLAEDGTEH